MLGRNRPPFGAVPTQHALRPRTVNRQAHARSINRHDQPHLQRGARDVDAGAGCRLLGEVGGEGGLGRGGGGVLVANACLQPGYLALEVAGNPKPFLASDPDVRAETTTDTTPAGLR